MKIIKEIFLLYPELWLALLSLVLSLSGLHMIGFGVFIAFALIILIKLIVSLFKSLKKNR